MTFPSSVSHLERGLATINCDQCGVLSECRFEYIDANQGVNGNLPMLFCSLDCLERYLVEAKGLQGESREERRH